jgi:hypothetical protein
MHILSLFETLYQILIIDILFFSLFIGVFLKFFTVFIFLLSYIYTLKQQNINNVTFIYQKTIYYIYFMMICFSRYLFFKFRNIYIKRWRSRL